MHGLCNPLLQRLHATAQLILQQPWLSNQLGTVTSAAAAGPRPAVCSTSGSPRTATCQRSPASPIDHSRLPPEGSTAALQSCWQRAACLCSPCGGAMTATAATTALLMQPHLTRQKCVKASLVHLCMQAGCLEPRLRELLHHSQPDMPFI